MKNKILALIAMGLSCLLLQGCGQKDTVDSEKLQRDSTFVEVPKDGKLTDAKGDVRPATATMNVAFIDLTEMTVKVTETNITVTMTVADLPEEFTYNQAEPDQLEYSWKILFDTDNNSKTSVGDLALYLAYLRHSHTMGAEEAQGALLDFAKPTFHVVSKANHSGYSDTGFFDDKISTTVSENTITFSVDKSSHMKLNNITSSTKVRFEAHYLDGSNNYFSDYYPNAHPQFSAGDSNAFDLKKFADKFRQIYNSHDATALAQLYTENATCTISGEPARRGRKAIEDRYATYFRAFPDLEMEYYHTLDSGDGLFCEAIIRGTNTGPLATPEGEIPPTGRSIEIVLVSTAKVKAEGILAEHRTYFDKCHYNKSIIAKRAAR